MRSYQETIDYLYSQLPVFSVVGAGAYKPGLGTAIALSGSFGNPHKSYPTIHVAGTNGKGSTSSMLASILKEAGYRVGLYTSPHIYDFRERIRVNGDMIPKQAVVDFVEKYIRMNIDCKPSFFELTTIMAFDYFRSSDIDIAVIETGLGGRLDTTNIITPLISIITNVSLDHIEQLGDSITKIAAEKAGIIKKGVPTVIGYAGNEERAVFDKVAINNHSSLIYASDSPLLWRGEDSFELIKKDVGDDVVKLKCDLEGDFQLQNINTVLHAIRMLKNTGVNIEDNHVVSGLSHVSDNTHLYGRWSNIEYKGVRIITDTGHNIGAWEWIAPRLREIAKDCNLHAVLGFVADKQIEPIFRILPVNAHYHLVSPSVKRARRVDDLAQLAEKYHLNANVYSSVREGCMTAFGMCQPGDTLFIGGSNYLVSEVRIPDFFQTK